MRKRREIKRKRIIAYYILAIVLPCLILGILAFRGIINDQALVEREHRNNLAEDSQNIIQGTEAYLTSVERDFVKIIESILPPQKTIFAHSLLSQFILQHQVVAGIFYVSKNSRPKMLNSGMMYVPDNSLTRFDLAGFKNKHSILDKARQYEFKEKNYQMALKYYQTVLPDAHKEQSRGEILNAIARVQKKLDLNDKAIETYDLIYDKYSLVFIQNRIPLGTVALLEKSSLYIKKSDSISALENIQLLLNQIQKSRWEIGFPYFTFILSKADKIILGCENSNNKETKKLLLKIHSIQDSISMSQIHTEYLLSFLGSNEIKLIEQELIPANSIQRQKTRINDKLYFWSLQSVNNTGKWGILIDTDYLLMNTIRPLLLEKENESNFKWQITDDNGGLILKSEYITEDNLPVYAAFPSNLPALTLKLYPENSGLLNSLFYSRGGLYFYIFIVIIIILAFGLFFTLRTINNEIHFSKMKSNFMSTVSHEFKSPLTSIRQMAEMLDRDRVPTTEKKKKYYNMILLQSERLSHLIENILDFSKMEDDKKVFRFEKDNIVSTARDAVASFKNNMVNQSVQINLSDADSIPEIVFDKESIEQVMHNLLDNASKYSGDSNTINVEIVTKGKDVIINVTDFGVGINNNDKDKIFDRFYRAGDELTQSVKGSGIGLTIVKQIMIAHKGDIVVDSNPGKGSTFSIILPVT